MADDRITIVDFGGQYAHLISRRLRDLGAYAALIPASHVQPSDLNARGVIFSGGPRSVGKVDSIEIPEFIRDFVFDQDIPVLGICYGHQLLGHLTGGTVSYSDNREYGGHKVTVVKEGKLTPPTTGFQSWMSHGDHVSTVGEGFVITASTDNCPVAAMENHDKRIYGVQFHPEVTHTEFGFEILEKFVHEICEIVPQTWDLQHYIDDLVKELQDELSGKNVIIGVSGGVDSTVSAMLLHRALGDSLHAVFVNHGLLRHNEVEQVNKYFQEDFGFKNFHVVDAVDLFLDKLKGEIDPEKKREIIGHTFIEAFETKAHELEEEFGTFTHLAQGTIYSDRIESGAVGAESEKIKSHHNLTLPDVMKLEIVEPMKDLYKDEVRKIGYLLDIPANILERYPFPGPGLAVRIVGEVTRERLEILRKADHIFTSMIYKKGVSDLAWQAFAALLPVKATGVQGDNRAYGYIIALRSVASREGMTADFSKFSWEFLSEVSTRIINAIPEVTRCVYDISTKPPGTIEFE